MRLVKVTTRGNVRCCGVPMRNLGPLPALGCRQCGKHMDANDPVWVGRNSWDRLRKKHGQREYKGLHVMQDFSPHACTGLHCPRPECRKRRKERLRTAWEWRRARHGVFTLAKCDAALAVIAENERRAEKVTIQDDRWRLDVEARAIRANERADYAGVRARWDRREWSRPFACAAGAADHYRSCVGGLAREDGRMGARLLCLKHHPKPSIYPETFNEWRAAR